MYHVQNIKLPPQEAFLAGKSNEQEMAGASSKLHLQPS